MKRKMKYAEEPMGHLRVVKDFSPPPTGKIGIERR